MSTQLDPEHHAAPPAGHSEERRRLDRSLMGGMAWTGGMKWLTQLLSWVSMLVVARLLTEADFGLVGAASVFIGLITLVSELGLGAAIVQRRDLSEDQIARLGGVSVILGFLLALGSAAAALPVAAFFRKGAVAGVVSAMGATFITAGLQVVPRSLLQRELQFRRLAWMDGLQAVVGTACTLGLAFLGFRYWALVFSNLITGVVMASAFFYLHPHRLAWPRDLKSISSAITFGRDIAVSRVAWYGYSNADFTLVGRVLGVATLGFYSIGWTIASVPVDRVAGLVSRVIPAIFSAVQHDLPALRRYVLRLTEGLALITFPASLGLAAVAEDFVPVVLGERWRPAILPLRLLAFYAGFRSITTIFGHLLPAVGQARRSMQFSLLALAVLPPMFYFGTRWGTAGVAAAWIIGYPLVMIPVFRTVFRLIALPGMDYLKAVWPALSASVVMAGAVLLIRATMPGHWPLSARLALEVGAGALTYLILLHLLHRDRVRAVVAVFRDRGR